MRLLTCNPANRVLMLMLLACFCISARAQEVRKFEGEIGVAVPFAATKFEGGKFEPAWHAYIEGRYNFRSLPLDVGLQYERGFFSRQWGPGAYRDPHFNTILIVSDYNFRRTKRVSFFVGLGAGCSFVKVTMGPNNQEHDFTACVMPRVGAEFFHHVRLTVGYRLRSQEFSNAEVALGIVIGGGRKR